MLFMSPVAVDARGTSSMVYVEDRVTGTLMLVRVGRYV